MLIGGDFILEDEKVSMFIPFNAKRDIEKSEKSKEKNWYVSGYASTPHTDLQKDRVDPMGIDYKSYFLDHGWINYDHKQDLSELVGAPISVNASPKGLSIEGILFKSVQRAQEIHAIEESLSKGNYNRSLGFSIEGGIIERSPTDPHLITKSFLRNVAITPWPANTEATMEMVVKSESASESPEKKSDPLAQAINTICYARGRSNLNSLLQTCENSLRDSGNLSKSNLCLILQIGRGISYTEAKDFVDNYYKKEG
mgnify:CR=1 FL=1